MPVAYCWWDVMTCPSYVNLRRSAAVHRVQDRLMQREPVMAEPGYEPAANARVLSLYVFSDARTGGLSDNWRKWKQRCGILPLPPAACPPRSPGICDPSPPGYT